MNAPLNKYKKFRLSERSHLFRDTSYQYISKGIAFYFLATFKSNEYEVMICLGEGVTRRAWLKIEGVDNLSSEYLDLLLLRLVASEEVIREW